MQQEISDIRKEKYSNKLKGYTHYPRQEILMLQFLSDGEFALYQTLKFLVADWDPRHITYGHFILDTDQISYYTGWSAQKTNRLLKRLVHYGLITSEDPKDRLFRVSAFNDWREFTKTKDDEYILKILEPLSLKKDINLKHNERKIDILLSKIRDLLPSNSPTKTTNSSKYTFNIGSYKGNVGYSVPSGNEDISDTEMDEIVRILDSREDN